VTDPAGDPPGFVPALPAWAGWQRAMAAQWRALALAPEPSDLRLPCLAGLLVLGLHALGLLAIVRLSHHPWWLALPLLLLLQPSAASLYSRRWLWFPAALAPLVVTYAGLALRLLIALLARAGGTSVGSLQVPEPWGSALDIDLMTALGVLWALLAQASSLALAASAGGRRLPWPRLFGLAALAGALVWSALTYATIATHGVTGSDPYAYAQMGVDIATHGTPLHLFALAPQVAGWGLPVWPAVPVGYAPPDPVSGIAATVWAPGQGALLAAGDRKSVV
jgi:hypothetical protein